MVIINNDNTNIGTDEIDADIITDAWQKQQEKRQDQEKQEQQQQEQQHEQGNQDQQRDTTTKVHGICCNWLFC